MKISLCELGYRHALFYEAYRHIDCVCAWPCVRLLKRFSSLSIKPLKIRNMTMYGNDGAGKRGPVARATNAHWLTEFSATCGNTT